MELPYRANKQNDEIVEEKNIQNIEGCRIFKFNKTVKDNIIFYLMGFMGIVNVSVCGGANTVLIYIM